MSAVVASFLQSAGDGILAKPEIETVDQMAGKTYAGSSFSYVTTLMPIFEQAAGLEPGSINMQITSGGQMQLFIAGEADMIPGQGWAEVPNFTAQGIDFNFFPMAEYGLDLIGPGITTNADTLAEDPEMVASFVAASPDAVGSTPMTTQKRQPKSSLEFSPTSSQSLSGP